MSFGIFIENDAITQGGGILVQSNRNHHLHVYIKHCFCLYNQVQHAGSAMYIDIVERFTLVNNRIEVNCKSGHTSIKSAIHLYASQIGVYELIIQKVVVDIDLFDSVSTSTAVFSNISFDCPAPGYIDELQEMNLDRSLHVVYKCTFCKNNCSLYA